MTGSRPPFLEARDLERRVRHPQRPRRARPRRRPPVRPARRDPGHRRRVRLRQDHAGPHAHRAAAAHLGRGALRGHAAELLVRGRCGRYRSRVQMVLQDAAGSLNPRQTVYESVAEGIRLHGRVAATDEQGRTEAELVAAALSEAGPAAAGAAVPPLPARAVRRPEAAGADRRGAGAAARADPGRRAGLLARRLDPRRDPRAAARAAPATSGMGVVVVTHDLGLAWNIADRIAVMYLGRVVECGTTEEVLGRAAAPLHPGAALRGARDRATWSRSSSPARSRTRAGSRPAAGSTRAAPSWPTVTAERGRRRRGLPRARRSRCFLPPATTGWPAISTPRSRAAGTGDTPY